MKLCFILEIEKFREFWEPNIKGVIESLKNGGANDFGRQDPTSNRFDLVASN